MIRPMVSEKIRGQVNRTCTDTCTHKHAQIDIHT
jgi:hypothetical protein